MKASELIKALQDQMESYGDLEVTLHVVAARGPSLSAPVQQASEYGGTIELLGNEPA